MQIGINLWTFPSELPLQTCFAQARAAGFDSVEVNLAEAGAVTPAMTEDDARAIVSLAEREGVRLSSLSTGLFWRYPLTAPEPDVREQAKTILGRQLQIARWLGVDTILVVPGTVNAEVAYDTAYDRAQSALRELAGEAERLGVAIGVENVWNKFLLSPLEFVRFLDEIDSPAVGAYFDVGNVLAYGYPEQWIRLLGKRVRKIHVKDFRGSVGTMQGFCYPLQGDVAWERVRAALETAGYDGPITAEVDGLKTQPEVGLQFLAQSLRAIFQPDR